MGLPENPPDVPRSRGLLEKIRRGISSVRSVLVSLFTEDPQITAILTPAFLDEFYKEYLRMCKERREGIADADTQPSFWDHLYVDGCDMRCKIFEVLINEYPQINALPDDLRQKVRSRLFEHCGVLPYTC